MIAIVGATGVLGRELARQLLEAGRPVAAVTRDPARAAGLARLGAEVRVADLTDPPSLAGACRGAEAVVAAAHGMLGRGRYRSEAVDDAGHRALVDAARAEGVGHFVYTSVLGASPDHPVDFWRRKHATEAYVKASGLRYTILRPAAFMETHAHELLGKGILAGGAATILGRGDRPTNFVAVRDVARVAVLALTEPPAESRTIEIGGPENPTRLEVAALYGRLSGRAPTVRRVPPGALRALGAAMRPLHPGVSRVLRASVALETVDQTFDPAEMLRAYPIALTRLEDFVRERVAESRGAAARGAPGARAS